MKVVVLQEHKKLEAIKNIQSEDDLRIGLIIPLFRKMGYRVLDNQAHDEFGTDVILVETTKIGEDEYTSIVLKKGDIDNKAGSPNNLLRTLLDQSVQATKLPLSHPSLKNIYPNKVWVVTNGKITRNAQKMLSQLVKEQSTSIANYNYIAGADLVGLIDKYWPEFYRDSRPFLSQYQDLLKKDLFDLDVSDLGGGNRSVESVLIPQVLIEEKAGKTDFKKVPLTPIQLIDSKSKIVFVSGEAGAGKSTLLKRLAIDIIEVTQFIPICISANKILETNFTVHEITKQATILSGEDLEQAQSELSNAKIILLVDAIDEIRDLEKRKEVLASLDGVIEDTSSGIERVVITTRTETNKENLKTVNKQTSYDLSPVAQQHVIVFFQKWFGGKGNQKLDKLFRELKSKNILQKMPKTPMTLTLLAILYESKGDIPSTLTELYKMFADLLLGKWDMKKGIDSLQTSQIRFGVLSYVALQMHERGLNVADQESFVNWAKVFLVERLGDTKTNVKKLVQDIIDRSGLLSVTGGTIKFKHFSFQEFFCAQEIFSKKIFSDNLENWIEDDWWSDVLFFSSGSLRSLDDHFKLIYEAKFDDNFTARITIGNMLQAAYETSIFNKRALIASAKNDVFNIIEKVQEEIDVATDGMIPNFIPYFFVMDLISDSYASQFMESSLVTVLDESINDGESENVIESLFLAMALAKSGNLVAIEELCTRPSINDPIALLLTDMVLDQYSSRFVGKGKPPAIQKSIKKKIKNNIPAIRALLKPTDQHTSPKK